MIKFYFRYMILSVGPKKGYEDIRESERINSLESQASTC